MERSGPSPAHKWAPIVIAAIGTLWALQYVLETRIETADEPDTFLFISFLIWPLGAAAIAVIVNAIRHAPTNDQPPPVLDPDSIGLKEPRRVLLASSLPIFGVAIVFGGFLIPSLLYIFLMVRFLGVKNLALHAGLAVCVLAIVWLGFYYLLGVPLQLWPPGLKGPA